MLSQPQSAEHSQLIELTHTHTHTHRSNIRPEHDSPYVVSLQFLSAGQVGHFSVAEAVLCKARSVHFDSIASTRVAICRLGRAKVANVNHATTAHDKISQKREQAIG